MLRAEFASIRWVVQCNSSYAVLKKGGTLVAINQLTETSTGSLQTVAAMIDAGTIKPFVGKIYLLSQVAQAWHDVQSKNIEEKTVFAVGG